MCNNPKYFRNIVEYGTNKMLPVPCHMCEGCRIDRISMWQRRIESEYVKYRCAFVTLTYNDYYLPFTPKSILPTCRMADFRKFVARLHRVVNSIPDSQMPDFCTKDFKIVGVSEYGSKTNRPHYHFLALGLDWLDFKNVIKDCWFQGISDIGPIRRGGIRYILKYMDKQQFGEYSLRQFFDYGLEKPQFYFSRGIGKDWFLSQIENINKYGMAKIGTRLVPIPSYWKNKLFHFCDENIYAHRELRNQYVEQMNNQVRSFGYDSYDDFLRRSRKALEMSYEKRKLKSHVPVSFLSHEISDSALGPFSDLLLNYR